MWVQRFPDVSQQGAGKGHPCEVRLAMNADKLIEDTFITLKEY
jgi:hypothetical protein